MLRLSALKDPLPTSTSPKPNNPNHFQEIDFIPLEGDLAMVYCREPLVGKSDAMHYLTVLWRNS
jgi:hypothetical protein